MMSCRLRLSYLWLGTSDPRLKIRRACCIDPLTGKVTVRCIQTGVRLVGGSEDLLLVEILDS